MTGSTNPTGSPCPPFFYCPGAASPPLMCDCPGVCKTGGFSSQPPANWAWTSTTIAGTSLAGYKSGVGTNAGFNAPNSITLDGTSMLWVSNTGDHLLLSVSPTSGATDVFAGNPFRNGWRADGQGTRASFNGISQAVYDPQSGNIFVADWANSLVRAISTATAWVSVLAGSGQLGYSNGAGVDASFNSPMGVAMSPGGLVYVSIRITTLFEL